MSFSHRFIGRILALLLVALGLAAVWVAPATSADQTGISTSAQLAGGAVDPTLTYCDDNQVPANDDYWTAGGITPPFPLIFFGVPQTQMFVNNNGNVTFGSGLDQYTPTSLNGGTQFPIIAPFFADFDTSGVDSPLTTYGSSPDGKTFCAQWKDLGYFKQHMDKTNSVQLLLRSTQDEPGRSPGDFDITFNYDRITWEAGDASGGAAGLAGTSAAAGFSARHGTPGSFFQLPGSFVNGAFLDGGPNALVSGSHGSTQPGRYVFEVRNATFTPTASPAVTPTPTPTPPPTVAVVKKSSTALVKLSAKKIPAGGTVKVKVVITVAPGGSKSGSVSIKDGNKVVKKIAKLKSGKATVKLKNIKRGKHKIKAVFSGNTTTLGSTSKAVRLIAR